MVVGMLKMVGWYTTVKFCLCVRISTLEGGRGFRKGNLFS